MLNFTKMQPSILTLLRDNKMLNWRTQSYARLSSDGSDVSDTFLSKEKMDEHVGNLPRKHRRRSTHPALVVALTILAVLAIQAAAAYIYSRPKPGPKADYSFYENLQTHVESNTKHNDAPHPCGNSSAEARALGCRFDQLTWAWMPGHCPSHANDAFMNAEEQPWLYFEDVHGKKVVEGEAWESVGLRSHSFCTLQLIMNTRFSTASSSSLDSVEST